MPRDGTVTRDRILDSAERLIIDRGFAATTVDAILADAGTTKGAFFHHFASKAELARSLVERYAAADIAALEDFMMRAEARATTRRSRSSRSFGYSRRQRKNSPASSPAASTSRTSTRSNCSTTAPTTRSSTPSSRGVNGYAQSSRRPPRPTHLGPRRTRLARRPGLHHLRGRLHPRADDARPDTPARTAHPFAPLPPTLVRSRADDALGQAAGRPHRSRRWLRWRCQDHRPCESGVARDR